MLSLFWGFRLTIWNVNGNSGDLVGVPGEGFRLTIWNVNVNQYFPSLLCYQVLD